MIADNPYTASICRQQMYFAFLDKLNKMKKHIEEIRMIANIGIVLNFVESDTDAKDIIINQTNKFLLFITFQQPFPSFRSLNSIESNSNIMIKIRKMGEKSVAKEDIYPQNIHHITKGDVIIAKA